MSAPAQNLPVEVIDCILDGNRGDRPSLKSSSLVCKAWLQSSRYHLFSEFDVYVGLDVGKKFLKLLHHPLCTFVYCIRTITLYPGQPDASGIAPLGDKTVSRLAKLMHVSSLRIFNHRGLIAKSTLALLASTFKDVETLRLTNPFASVNDAVEFVASFPKLKTLDFYPYCHDGTPATLPSTLPPSKLSRVQLHSPFFYRSWFVEHHDRIPTLTLTDVKASDLDKVEEILAGFGSSLRDLRMAFFPKEVSTSFPVSAFPQIPPPAPILIGGPFAAILLNQRLTSLELIVPKASLHNLLEFVEKMRLPSLRVLSWTAPLAETTALDMPARIDKVLSNRARFQSLKEVHITTREAVSYSKSLDKPPSREFPRADAVGIAVTFRFG
ncbi:hypothetical protein B0H16DRAFT_1806991 [Mycena metata]|uniref:F-box domain-containing protein n=1 Tax=Mycena metata TaxID=1033252 RepID=A0AAD7JFZ4_9AGAR|nr:hypothetical protein B0H16DRAFT_1806991 [Mycena metata]